MSTVHTSAASLYRAILDAASTSWEDSEAVTLEAVRPGDPDEDASNYCTAEFRGPWLDVKRAMLLEVPMHGPVRPYPAPATFAFQSNGARASFKIKGNRTRLLAMAEQVRKHWALYGGGPVPAELAKPKAAKRAVTWPASIIKVWLQQFEDKDYAGAMLTGERLDAVFYPGAKGCAFILAAPIQVEGLPEGVCSARRNDGKWVVACMQSGRAIESRGYGSRKTAEESALSEVARVGLDKLTAALERNRADAVDHDEARAAWCKACNIEDPREPAPVAQPAPEFEEGAESADDWAARMVAMVSQPVDVAQPEELDERARAVIYAVHCRTAAIARQVAADVMADGVRLRRSVNEAGFNAASMALRRSVAQAVRAARRGPVARDVAPDADEVARIVGVMAGKPDAAADLRARADNMRAGVRQGMQWPGAVQDAAADLTMTRARVYDAAADAIDARPGPDAAPVAPVAHAAPPVGVSAPPVAVSADPDAPTDYIAARGHADSLNRYRQALHDGAMTLPGWVVDNLLGKIERERAILAECPAAWLDYSAPSPDAAMMRSAADRAQVLADGIKAAAGDDPATMARMLKSEAARIKAAALGMPARIAASYRATADMLEYAAELHADAAARKVPDMALKPQPGTRVQATARRTVMARRSPLAQPWRMAPSVARRIGRQARRGPAQGRAAPRMRPQAAAPPVWVCAAPVGESGQRFN